MSPNIHRHSVVWSGIAISNSESESLDVTSKSVRSGSAYPIIGDAVGLPTYSQWASVGSMSISKRDVPKSLNIYCARFHQDLPTFAY